MSRAQTSEAQALICTIACILALVAGSAQASPKANGETPTFAASLYQGWRASRLIGSHVFSEKPEYLGRVRNLVIADDGQIKSIIIEGDRIRGVDEFVFQVPWERLAHPVRPGVLVARIADKHANEFGLFLDFDQGQHRRPDFLVSEVLGDYARLQAGQGYGYLKDVVFTEAGKMLAVLIARDFPSGGGTYAFGFPGRTGRWSPDASYYGLPYVTVDQANSNGLKVDPTQFSEDRAG